MKLVCISDTHGDHEALELPAGDVLIHAGDVSAHGREFEVQAFMQWLGSRGFDYTLCIAGNHDLFMEQEPVLAQQYADDHGVTLLNDSGCKVGGRKFWGSPITPRFHNWSFMRDPGEPIDAHWRKIPLDTDVLITHGPPHGIMDAVRRQDGRVEYTGCPSLLARVKQLSPALHIFGHIHECHGKLQQDGVTFLNVSTMNEHYRIEHLPVVVELP